MLQFCGSSSRSKNGGLDQNDAKQIGHGISGKMGYPNFVLKSALLGHAMQLHGGDLKSRGTPIMTVYIPYLSVLFTFLPRFGLQPPSEFIRRFEDFPKAC